MSHNMSARISVSVQRKPFSVGRECADLTGGGEIGATTFFVGSVRGGEVSQLCLEHYPGMTEQALADIAAAAAARWEVLAVRVVHRVGALAAGEGIVFVGVAAAHRAAAFAACEYVVDFLKSRAPFWKKEITAAGARWVAAAAGDEEALRRWE